MKEESLQFLKSVGKHIFWILFDGTLIWYLWPIVVPGIIPWRVAGGSLMAQIYWIDGVGLVNRSSIATTSNRVKENPNIEFRI